MPRRKKKANSDDHIDRISDIPSNVIDNILKHLPIDELIRTSILSKKWRYKWSFSPTLEFENDFFQKYKHLKYLETSNIISNVLLLHIGPIYKFSLHIPTNIPIKMECLSKWILFISRNGIQDLKLVNFQIDAFQTPSHLFSCQELTCLKLQSFKMSIPSNFKGFKNLLELHLFYIRFESTALDSLISGCPLLGVLIVSHCSGFEHINVSTPTLKLLNVEGDHIIKSVCSERVNNLHDLKLIAKKPWDNSQSGRISYLIKGMPNIENICLGPGYIKIFSIGCIPPQMRQISSNCLKHLALKGVNLNEARELLWITSLLKSSPNLKELFIKCDSQAMPLVEQQQIVLESNCNRYYLNQLQIVRIIVKSVDKNELNMVRFLLANSSSLKILMFKVCCLKKSDAAAVLKLSRELLQMKRASQRAEVKLLYDDLNE
ncbi:hypothetical protein RJT34_07053 [Clitoria ternatea]|uniref:F-box domain-containing protein n=1 Tax=Clitoria ternatea TaxID=43366 RepID=A0AAN9K410_CLITE